MFPPKEADETEKEDNSFMSESEQDGIRECSIQDSSIDDEVVKPRRKKSSLLHSNISSIVKGSQGEDENEVGVAQEKYRKSRFSSFTKRRNNIRVMLSKFVRTNNNNTRRHERTT